MKKALNVILVAFQPQAVKTFFDQIDYSKIHLLEVFSDRPNQVHLVVDGNHKDILPLHSILPYIEQYREEDVYWILGSAYFESGNLEAIAKLLRARGIPSDHVLNGFIGGFYNDVTHYQWNLRYAEREPLDYIATGISYIEKGLDITQLPYRGGNLAASSQDLYYSYRTAVDIFAHGNPLKFCLIGVCPYILSYEMRQSFATIGASRQYELLLPGEAREEDIFFGLLSDSFKKGYVERSAPADLGNVAFRRASSHDITLDTFFNVERALKDVIVKLRQKSFQNNLQILQSYIRLCQEHGAKPIAVMLPFSPVIHDRYPQRELADFRAVLQSLHDTMGLEIIDLFDLRLDYDCFCDLTHMNMRGAAVASRALNEQLERVLHYPPKIILKSYIYIKRPCKDRALHGLALWFQQYRAFRSASFFFAAFSSSAFICFVM